ncbi:MAG: hypothetical protein K9L17_10710 [Clostridiales bacterium]|nr:hypothetical protein [Clostridiales bacterium]MCF8023151.1 hypothetical protein [Clostridiales bacterium]
MVSKINKFKPLYIDETGGIWGSDGYYLIYSNDFGLSYTKIARCMTCFVDQLKASTRLTSRLFRSGFHYLLPLRDGTIIGVVRGFIVKRNFNDNFLYPVFKIDRGSRPLNLCSTPDDKICFGEYFKNSDRDEVHIYGSFDCGETWKIIYTFPEGSIRHVHGIFYDKYRKGCWVLTGDFGNECRILFTGDNFNSLEPVVIGNQQARAVSIIPLADGLIVPTDTPIEQNYIQWLDIKTGKFERLHPLSGSAFYTAQVGDYYLVSTVVEPSDVNTSKEVAIYTSRDGENWQVFYKQKKDVWPQKLFQYGALQLPAGPNPGPYVYAYGQAVQKDDGKLLRWKLF